MNITTKLANKIIEFVDEGNAPSFSEIRKFMDLDEEYLKPIIKKLVRAEFLEYSNRKFYKGTNTNSCRFLFDMRGECATRHRTVPNEKKWHRVAGSISC